jgi:chromosome segregation ATPase
MKDTPASGFKIGQDNEVPQPFMASGRENFRPAKDAHMLKKINQRLTLFSLLIPCLMAAILFAVYTDMKNRFGDMYSNRVERLEALSREMEAKSAALSEQYDTLVVTMAQQEEPLKEAFIVFERTSESLRDELAQLTDQIQKSEEGMKQALAGKADLSVLETVRQEWKTTTAAVEGIKGDWVSVQEEIKSIRTELKTVDEKIKNDTEPLAESLETVKNGVKVLSEDLKKLKADLVEVLSATVDKKGLNQALKDQEKQYREYQKQLDSFVKKLYDQEKEINALQESVRKIDNRIKKSALGTPKPGTILEQNIE